MQPGVAKRYLLTVADAFEAYAKKHYPAALAKPAADPDLTVAAARYIATRRVDGHEKQLREALTTTYRGALGVEISEACVEALMATTEKPVEGARLLALIATGQESPASRACANSLRRRAGEATEAILRELTHPHPPVQLRKLARLLAEISKVPSPEPILFWQNADGGARAASAQTWRERIARQQSRP